MFLYSAESSPLDCSEPLHFAPWQSCSLRLFTHISSTVYSQVLIYTAEWTEASWREQKFPNCEAVAKGWVEPRLSRLRVQHSTTKLHVRNIMMQNPSIHIYYIKLQCPFACLSVCLYPPFFDTTVGEQPNLAHIFGSIWDSFSAK